MLWSKKDTMMYQQTLYAFIESMENAGFYDAHEILETLWYPMRHEKHETARCLQGLINAAVACELWRRKRTVPAQRTWQTYCTKYRPLLPLLPEQYREHFEAADTVANEVWQLLTKEEPCHNS
jgi:hypothetical protein